MKEYSDREIEQRYKDWKKAQVPPMWEQIEQRLTPKKAQVPSMQEQIEQRLAPKTEGDSACVDGREQDGSSQALQRPERAPAKPAAFGVRRRRFRIGRLAAAAAVLAVLLLAGPVWSMIERGTSDRKSQTEESSLAPSAEDREGDGWAESAEGVDLDAPIDSSTSGALEANGDGESVSEGGQAAEADQEANGDAEVDQETNGDAEAGQEANGDAEADQEAGGSEEAARDEAHAQGDLAGTEETKSEFEGQDNQESAKDSVKTEKGFEPFCCEITIKEVKVLPEGLQLTAWIADPGDSPYETDAEVNILYQGISYQKKDLIGTLRVQLQMEEKNLYLMKILP